MIGVRDDVTYEAQAAIELEMITESGVTDVYGYNIIADDEYIIDVGEVFRGIVFDLNHEVPKGVISAKFHNTVADFIVSMCEKLRVENNIDSVALSGGTFQNNYLISEVARRLNEGNFTTYFHKRVPTNDGRISLGQAVIANAQMD